MFGKAVHFITLLHVKLHAVGTVICENEHESYWLHNKWIWSLGRFLHILRLVRELLVAPQYLTFIKPGHFQVGGIQLGKFDESLGHWVKYNISDLLRDKIR